MAAKVADMTPISNNIPNERTMANLLAKVFFHMNDQTATRQESLATTRTRYTLDAINFIKLNILKNSQGVNNDDVINCK